MSPSVFRIPIKR